MANEGSTKPTYSANWMVEEKDPLLWELRYIADSPAQEHGGFHPRVVKAAQDALAELLRVRGLLQRQWISVEERLPKFDRVVLAYIKDASGNDFIEAMTCGEWEGKIEWYEQDGDFWGGDVSYWQPLPDPPNFPQSSSLVSQGAESADIGKPSTFAQWYPEAMKMVERYAPGELGLGNALAELLTRVANGELVSSGAESGGEMGKVNRVEEK